jgi:hypothetical protein
MPKGEELFITALQSSDVKILKLQAFSLHICAALAHVLFFCELVRSPADESNFLSHTQAQALIMTT